MERKRSSETLSHFPTATQWETQLGSVGADLCSGPDVPLAGPGVGSVLPETDQAIRCTPMQLNCLPSWIHPIPATLSYST